MQATGRIAPTSTGLRAEPAITMAAGPQPLLLAVDALADGGHAVAWLEAGGGLRAQRFDAATGRPAGDAVQLTTDISRGMPAAAVLPDGSVVVAAVVGGVASVDAPWITRTAIAVQRHDAAGAAVGPAVQVGAVEQDRIGAATMRFVADPIVGRRPDGSFVVAWTQVEQDSSGRWPQFFGQPFDALGQPAGSVALAATGDRDTVSQLAVSAAAGWLLATSHRTFGRTFLRWHAFDGAAAPVLPQGATGIAEGSLLLPLHGGRAVLLSPTHVYGSLQMYATDGQPLGMAGALAAPATAAVALADGGFATITPMEGRVYAQRYDADGRGSGDAVAIDPGAAAARGAALAGGGLVLAWVAGDRVSTQRLL